MTNGEPIMSAKRSLSEAAQTDERPHDKSSDEEVDEDEAERNHGGEGGENGEKTIPPINPALLNKAEAARRDERLTKNRQKARDRRNRKKALIEDMQRNVVVLSRMNAEIRRKNQDLIRQLAQYGAAGHPGGLGTDLGGVAPTVAGASQQAGVSGLTGQTALGGLATTTGQAPQTQVKGEEAQAGWPAAAAAPTTDINSILSQLPGAAQAGANATAAPSALAGAPPPSALGGLQLNQIANNPALMRLLSQQQGLPDTSQQLAALQTAVAGAQFAAQPAPAPMQASALGFTGVAQQPTAADSRPVHIVVHHHHPDGSQSHESQQISATAPAGGAAGAPAPGPGISIAGQTIPADLARQLNLLPGSSITMANPNQTPL